MNLGGPCDLLLTNRMWRSDATWPSRLSKIETFQLFLGFLGFLTQVEASCHVRNPTVLRAWCCEKAQATHMGRLGGDREREGQPAPRNPSHPCRGAKLVSEETFQMIGPVMSSFDSSPSCHLIRTAWEAPSENTHWAPLSHRTERNNNKLLVLATNFWGQQ